ncbi:MAG: hypothetical protein AAFX08_12625 [Pseudomonadota bacterium]
MNAERGFAMLDVIVALTIAAVGGAALIAANNLAARAAAQAEARLGAMAIARVELSAPGGSRTGETDLEDRSYHWAVEAEPPTEAGLIRKTIIVSWGGSDAPRRSVTLETAEFAAR